MTLRAALGKLGCSHRGVEMKAFGLGLAVALAATAAAHAGAYEDNEAQGWIQPKAEAENARWPRDAEGRLIYGKVVLDCGVSADGHASDCRSLSSEPPNPVLETAVQSLTPFYTTKDDSKARRLLKLSLTFDTPPDWLKKPALADLMAVYPAQALKQRAGGDAIIECTVQITGLLRACSVVKEDRPELGFGPAALVMSRTFLFKPAMRAGQPVEAEVSVPIHFALAKGWDAPDIVTPAGPTYGRLQPHQSPADAPTTVLGEAVWSKTPTVADILAQINKKVGDKFAEGQVVFQCRLNKKSGTLNGCVLANISPGMAQFRDVAQSLVPKFQADPNILASAKGDVLVNLAFAFPDMSSPEWGKRYLTHPRWTRALGPDSNVSTFPEAAVKAGLMTGSATVDCVLAPNGALTKCQAIRESTPDVGFGETAIKIAQTFAANPWEEDGLPVDGAHVRMPIQMDYQPPADSPAANTPPPSPAAKP